MQQEKKILKVLCVSDTHGQQHHLDIFNEEGDIFIHAGDFTAYCRLEQVYAFCNFLDRLKFRHKVVICGNHELHFDEHLSPQLSKRKREHPCEVQNALIKKTADQLKQLLRKHCTYLENQYIEIQGVKIFGSPHAIRHGSTAFGYEKHMGDYVWAGLKKVDILITHGPPKGIFDIGKQEKKQLGCESLFKKVKEIKPKFHIFGHIHESGGNWIVKDGVTFANVAQCGSRRILHCRPFRFTIEV